LPRYNFIEKYSMTCVSLYIQDSECFRYVYDVEDEACKTPIGAECFQHRLDDMKAWNEKPRAEQVADAQFVMKWVPAYIVDSIRLTGQPTLIDALRIARHRLEYGKRVLEDIPAQESDTEDQRAMRFAFEELVKGE